MGKGGGDAHRLTPQNLVPLPEAKIDPPNREKMTFSRASPSLTHKKYKKKRQFLNNFHFLKNFCSKMAVAQEIFSLIPLPTHTLSIESSPPPWVFFCSPPPRKIFFTPLLKFRRRPCVLLTPPLLAGQARASDMLYSCYCLN